MINTYKQLLKNTTKSERANIKITVGISGGVDSATTAYLLKEAGFNVRGVFIVCYDDRKQSCRGVKDKIDAYRVATYLNIPFETWDFQKSYKKKVIDYFVNSYKKGLTPNPDILCNNEIKFKLFLNKAIKTGADYVATGHYAKLVNSEELTVNSLRNEREGIKKLKAQIMGKQVAGSEGKLANNLMLTIPKDKSKDQSYFLSGVSSSVYSKVLFPLGDYLKLDVRKIALLAKLPVATKKDSTGICFLEGIKMQDFLQKNIMQKTGKVVFANSKKVIGEHNGIWFYTIGQRHGFTVNKYVGKALYVLSKDYKKNILYVGEKPNLSSKYVLVKGKYAKKQYKNLYLRIRNLGSLYKIKAVESDGQNTKFVLFKAIESIAPGQFAVIYKKINSSYVVLKNYEIMV